MNNIVYVTTNLINGKKYIGSHNGKNPDYKGSGVYLAKAIKKYGKDNFKRDTLWEGPELYMREMEEYYIDYYCAYESPLFYNASRKGVGAKPQLTKEEAEKRKKQRWKKYRLANRERLLEETKERERKRYQDNKEAILKRAKVYRENNREKINEREKQRYHDNKKKDL